MTLHVTRTVTRFTVCPEIVAQDVRQGTHCCRQMATNCTGTVVVGIALAALVHKNHSAIDCYQFQGNAAFVQHCQYGGKKLSELVTMDSLVTDSIQSIFPQRIMCKCKSTTDYSATCVQVQIECFCVYFISDNLRMKRHH